MLKYLSFFLITLLLISCSNIKNNFVKNNFCYDNKLFNSELGISATFFGDMKHIELNKKNIKRTWNRTGYHPGSIHNTRSCRPHQSSRAFRREIWNSCLLHSGSTCRNQQKLLHDREIIDLRTLSAQR